MIVKKYIYGGDENNNCCIYKYHTIINDDIFENIEIDDSYDFLYYMFFGNPTYNFIKNDKYDDFIKNLKESIIKMYNEKETDFMNWLVDVLKCLKSKFGKHPHYQMNYQYDNYFKQILYRKCYEDIIIDLYSVLNDNTLKLLSQYPEIEPHESIFFDKIDYLNKIRSNKIENEIIKNKIIKKNNM